MQEIYVDCFSYEFSYFTLFLFVFFLLFFFSVNKKFKRAFTGMLLLRRDEGLNILLSVKYEKLIEFNNLKEFKLVEVCAKHIWIQLLHRVGLKTNIQGISVCCARFWD